MGQAQSLERLIEGSGSFEMDQSPIRAMETY